MVAFQEVRADLDEEHSQLLELKSLLPSYKWYVYRSSQRVTPFKGAPTGWEMEGTLKGLGTGLATFCYTQCPHTCTLNTHS